MANCVDCNASVGIFDRLRGRDLCSDCSQRRADAREKALVEYEQLLRAVANPNVDIGTVGEQFTRVIVHTGLSDDDVRQTQIDAFCNYAQAALIDDSLTVDEEARLFDIAELFGLALEDDDVTAALNALTLWPRLMVARANDGRLFERDDAPVALRNGEAAYFHMFAELLKRQAVKEWQSASAGVSFRVAKGVRFSTGQSRGRMVTIGSTLAAVDHGTLVATNRRIVFLGEDRSIEILLPRIISLELFNDAVRIHASGRAAPPLFRMPEGYANVFAATVNTLMQEID